MSYAKGVHYERSLIKFLNSQGFSTLRVAGSGHNTPVDIMAIKKGIVVAIECKAHANKPKIPQEKALEMHDWCETAGALGFLAWRAPKQDWMFLPIKNMIARTYDDENWLKMEEFLQTLI